MHKKFLATGAFLGALGVATGAFGAHGLQKVTSDEKIIQGFQTAVQYQLWHALALIAVGILFAGGFSARLLQWSAWCFITGILLFSGSLYLLSYLKIRESGYTTVIGPLTPLGGVLFIAGWLILAAALLKKKELQR
jgi:uncharacterized membrane protein YgdD (TMEM256/DUF423 family)